MKSNKKSNKRLKISYRKSGTASESNTNDSKFSEMQSITVFQKNQLFDKFTNNDLLQEAIAEIESTKSSSESEEIPEIVEEEDEKDFFAIEGPEKFLQFDTFFDEDLSSDDELEHLNENKLEKDLNFFDMFENVPEIDELSLAPTEDLLDKHQIVAGVDPTIPTDTGQFVNPLTGVKSSSSTTSSTISKEDSFHDYIEESELDDKESVESLSQESKSEILKADIVEPFDDFDDLAEPVKSNEVLQKFFEKDQEVEVNILNEYNAAKVALIRKEQERLNLQHTLDFLNKLIDRCVTKSEYIDDDIILQRNLDKKKLLTDLKAKYELMEVERRAMRFLNRKCVEYFKRKCSFRLISADDPKTLRNDRQNFYNALENLDKCLITEEKSKLICSAQVLQTREQFKEVKDHTMAEVEQLEHLIKTTFQRDNFNKLPTLLHNYLCKMSAIRKEISEVRFRLLLKQHDVSELGQHREKLENLGNNLKLTQYEAMETETNVLSKKLEERNCALKKLHKHYNSDLHNMAHLKEKQKMLRHIVSVEKLYLKQLEMQKNTCRSFNSELKVKRQKLRADIRNISHQSGLLDKPILMRDYDETVEKAKKLRKTNEDFKNTIEALASKIAELEKI